MNKPCSLFVQLLLINITINEIYGIFLHAQKVLDSVESPKILCEESHIRVFIRTNNAFGGNVYAKGFFNKNVCRVKGNNIENVANISIPISADCGIRKRRLVEPKGLILEMTIVLMFHNKFLTRNDKAYNIKCLYQELSQKVTNRLDVSSLPSTKLSESGIQLVEKFSLHSCKYEVLNNDENGQTISSAIIGQPVYHRWSCQTAETTKQLNANKLLGKLYCLTVHSCEVDDGQGNIQKLLDSNGCSIDKALLEEIEYKSDLEAGCQSFVFKFADRPSIYFSCQLRLERKAEWQHKCQRTSEMCRKKLKNKMLETSVTKLVTATPNYELNLSKSSSRHSVEENNKLLVTGNYKYASSNPQEVEPSIVITENASKSIFLNENDDDDPTVDDAFSNNSNTGNEKTNKKEEMRRVNGSSIDYGQTTQSLTTKPLVNISVKSTMLKQLRLIRSTKASVIRPLQNSVVNNENETIFLNFQKDQTIFVENALERSKVLGENMKKLSKPAATLQKNQTQEGRKMSLIDRNTALRQSELRAFIDIDVSAPEVDVLDVPQINNPSVQSFLTNNQNQSPKTIRDLMESNNYQVCISSKTLSFLLFLGILLIIFLIVLCIIIIYRIWRKNKSVALSRLLQTQGYNLSKQFHQHQNIKKDKSVSVKNQAPSKIDAMMAARNHTLLANNYNIPNNTANID